MWGERCGRSEMRRRREASPSISAFAHVNHSIFHSTAFWQRLSEVLSVISPNLKFCTVSSNKELAPAWGLLGACPGACSLFFLFLLFSPISPNLLLPSEPRFRSLVWGPMPRPVRPFSHRPFSHWASSHRIISYWLGFRFRPAGVSLTGLSLITGPSPTGISLTGIRLTGLCFFNSR